MYGDAGDEVRGIKVAGFIIPSGLRKKHIRGLKRHLTTGKTRIIGKRMELTAMREDGHEFPVELSVSPVETAGRRLFTAFIRDLSERKKMENLSTRLGRIVEESLRRSQKMEVIGHLTGGIAHDFNNLLGIIMGNLEILQRMVRDDEALLKRANAALRGVKRGADLEAWISEWK